MADNGDYVVCRDVGVCRATAAPQDAELVTVTPYLFPKEMKTIPTEAIVRPVMDRADAEEVIERVPYLQTIQAPKEKAYGELLQAAFAKYAPIEWVRIVKSAHIRQQHQRLSAFERPYADKAKEYLHSELSLVLGIPYDEVEAHIQRYIANELN